MITQAELQEAMTYNPDTGVFTWNTSRNIKASKGQQVGSLDTDGYLRTSINGVHHKLHRLAFLYVEGTFPVGEVDHKNGVKTDNAWANLRKATVTQNRQNVGRRTNNTSGYTGVSWSKTKGKWRASYGLNGKSKHIGYYVDAYEAHLAYLNHTAPTHAEYHYTNRSK